MDIDWTKMEMVIFQTPALEKAGLGIWLK